MIGVGTMGQHHVRVVSQSAGVTLAGFYDVDPARADEICLRHGCRCFDSLDELIDNADAVTVAAPTSLHAEIGQKCLVRGIHLLMEKPLAHDLEAAARLVELSRTTGAVLMVGHIERYNPAVGTLIELLNSRREEVISIDARRLAPFDGTRCMDADVLHDLMIHDVDLALEIADSPIVRVSASGRSVFSDRTDVAHARIEFENHATAVFWTARCSPRRMRSFTVTTPSRYIAADTVARSVTVFSAEEIPSLEHGLCTMGEIRREEISAPDDEPLRRELEDFFRAIRLGTSPLVDGDRAVRAMKALDLIARAIERGVTVQEIV